MGPGGLATPNRAGVCGRPPTTRPLLTVREDGGCIVLVLGVGRCAFRPPRVVFVLGLVSLINSLTSGKKESLGRKSPLPFLPLAYPSRQLRPWRGAGSARRSSRKRRAPKTSGSVRSITKRHPAFNACPYPLRRQGRRPGARRCKHSIEPRLAEPRMERSAVSTVASEKRRRQRRA